jgi:hypothetical protein
MCTHFKYFFTQLFIHHTFYLILQIHDNTSKVPSNAGLRAVAFPADSWIVCDIIWMTNWALDSKKMFRVHVWVDNKKSIDISIFFVCHINLEYLRDIHKWCWCCHFSIFGSWKTTLYFFYILWALLR